MAEPTAALVKITNRSCQADPFTLKRKMGSLLWSDRGDLSNRRRRVFVDGKAYMPGAGGVVLADPAVSSWVATWRA